MDSTPSCDPWTPNVFSGPGGWLLYAFVCLDVKRTAPNIGRLPIGDAGSSRSGRVFSRRLVGRGRPGDAHDLVTTSNRGAVGL